MFLNDDDYKAVCDDFEFETLQANTDLRLTAERAAQEQISSYARGRYDMARAFRQTGEDRNPSWCSAVSILPCGSWFTVCRKTWA